MGVDPVRPFGIRELKFLSLSCNARFESTLESKATEIERAIKIMTGEQSCRLAESQLCKFLKIFS